jgi:hypothetical protein
MLVFSTVLAVTYLRFYFKFVETKEVVTVGKLLFNQIEDELDVMNSTE